MIFRVLLLSVLLLFSTSSKCCKEERNSDTVILNKSYKALHSWNDTPNVLNNSCIVGERRVYLGNEVQIIGGEPKKLLAQDMFYKVESNRKIPNTNSIFIIQHDFVLAENISIPENSILEFDGGSLSGEYTITGNNTEIRGYVRIMPDISFAGTFNNIETVFVDWFISDYKANEDCSNSIRKAISLAKQAHASLTFGGYVSDKARKYYCNSGNFDVSGLVINGNGATIISVGNFDLFIVDGYCKCRDIQIGKYPYQDDSSTNSFKNTAIMCKNNHQMKFENVFVDGFHYGFLLDAAWNVVIDACNTYRCSVGVGSKGLSVNNNIHNSRISGTVCGIDVKGVSEGWMISDNVIIGSTGLRFTNHANTIIKGNIVDLCSKYAMEIIGNCPGMLIDNNYMAIEKGGESIIIISSQDIKNNEDQMISITNNILRGYDSMKGETGISVTSGKYKHIKIMGNHIKSNDLKYGISIDKDVSIGTLFMRDNVVEGKENIPPVRIQGKITNRFFSDNVKTRL